MSKRGAAFVWMDMEMSGLDTEEDVIMEVAVLVTDGQLEVLDEGVEIVLGCDDKVWGQMDSKVLKMHEASGLRKRVEESRISVREAEERLLGYIKGFFGENEALLCGNSVHFDRNFLRKFMPEVNNYLHYRMVDVSTIKELAVRWYQDKPGFVKKKEHRALVDIRESIEELRYWRREIFR